MAQANQQLHPDAKAPTQQDVDTTGQIVFTEGLWSYCDYLISCLPHLKPDDPFDFRFPGTESQYKGMLRVFEQYNLPPATGVPSTARNEYPNQAALLMQKDLPVPSAEEREAFARRAVIPTILIGPAAEGSSENDTSSQQISREEKAARVANDVEEGGVTSSEAVAMLVAYSSRLLKLSLDQQRAGISALDLPRQAKVNLARTIFNIDWE